VICADLPADLSRSRRYWVSSSVAGWRPICHIARGVCSEAAGRRTRLSVGGRLDAVEDSNARCLRVWRPTTNPPRTKFADLASEGAGEVVEHLGARRTLT